MANIGELSVGIKVDQQSLNNATKEVKQKFKEIGDQAEKSFEVDGKGLKSFNKDLGDTENKIKNMGGAGAGGIKKLIGVFAGLYATVKSLGFVWNSYNMALAENSQYERLYKLLNNVHGATREHVQVLNDQAKAIERVGVVTAGNVTQVQSQLATFDLSIEAIERLTPAVIDYVVAEKGARASTDDFKSATNGLAQALNGNFQSLTAVGFVLDEATKKTISNGTEMERTEAIVDVLNSTYRGFNEALAQTDEGKVINLQNRFAVLRTELGKYLIPVFSKVLDLALQVMDVFKTTEERLEEYTTKIKDNENAQAFLKSQLEKGLITQDEYAEKMDQLTSKHEEFSDKAKNVGSDTISMWRNVLENVQNFFRDYGGIILETTKNTGKVIFDTIKDIAGLFKGLFDLIGQLFGQGESDINGFAFVFAHLVQSIGVGIKTIVTVIKSLVDIIAISMSAIVEYFLAGYNAIVKGWSIVKTSFVGTIKTIIDAVQLGAEVIAQVFVGMAEAIVGVFKGIADNVAVAIKKAGNFAIKGINQVINAVNKIPGVNLDNLVDFGDANFKSFELGITKNIASLGAKFDAFGAKVSNNYAGIASDFQSIGAGYRDATANVTGVTELAVDNMQKNWGDLADYVIDGNENIRKNTQKTAKQTGDEIETMGKKFDSAGSSAEKLGGDTKKAGEASKEAMDKIKKLYNDWEKSIEKVEKAQEDLAKNTKKYNEDIEDSLRKLGNELSKVVADYEKFVSDTQSEAGMDIATRGVAVQEELISLEAEIAKLKAKSFEDAEDEIERQRELVALEEEKTKLLKEQDFIIANSTEAQRNEASRVAGLSDAELIKEKADLEIAEQQKTFEAEKKRLESLQRINQLFLDMKRLDQKELDELIASDKFAQFTLEEQELILKLGREKVMLTQQKDDLIQMQQDIHDATVELSNSSTAIQQNNINTLKGEYAILIAQIQQAINKQRELNASRSSGFASGGFTGPGGTNEVAGVVHKGEWVAPKWMVNSMKPLFDNLESARSKGFADGGYTNTTNKTQNNNITVNSQVDLRGFLDYAKWKL